MIAVLGVLSAVALLVLIVYALHTFQKQKKTESIDRCSPLPPLNLQETAPQGQLDDHPTAIHANWQLRVKQLRDVGEYRKALSICKDLYPQLGAFKQACILLRAEIREMRRAGSNVEGALRELYTICAMAGLFHEKGPHTNPLSPTALKQVKYSEFEQLDMPYQQLGFEHLNLLTITDVKMLVDQWGLPLQHSYVRELHLVTWQQFLNILHAGQISTHGYVSPQLPISDT